MASSLQNLKPRGITAAASAANSSVPAAASGKPPLPLFLMNMRLLDLELLPDCLDMSLQTFVMSGSGVQDHKRRLRCVEWALLRLFSLWDPAETEHKMQPFFPPLDQIQSLNLRAALLRALEKAKKNGVLGRACVIRKTMLAECRGERLEEVLASLSTAVLKKMVVLDAARPDRYPSLAAALALEERDHWGSNQDLLALTLAHRVSLRRLFDRKEILRTRFKVFSDLLNADEHAIARRIQEIRPRERQNNHRRAVLDDAKAKMQRVFRNHWSGNEAWVEALFGTSLEDGTSLLTMPFGSVWSHIQQDRHLESQVNESGLLEQLDARIECQRRRLERWTKLRNPKCCPQPGPHSSPSQPHDVEKKKQGLDMAFTQHQSLYMEKTAFQEYNNTLECSPLLDEHAYLVHELRNELLRIRGRKHNPNGLMSLKKDTGPYHGDQKSRSTIGDLKQHPSWHPKTETSVHLSKTQMASPRRLDASEDIGLSNKGLGLPEDQDDRDPHRLNPVGLISPCEASSTPLRQSPKRQGESYSMQLPMEERATTTPSQEYTDRAREGGPEPLFRCAAADTPVATAAGRDDRVEDEAQDLVSPTRRSMMGSEKAK